MWLKSLKNNKIPLKWWHNRLVVQNEQQKQKTACKPLQNQLQKGVKKEATCSLIHRLYWQKRGCVAFSTEISSFICHQFNHCWDAWCVESFFSNICLVYVRFTWKHQQTRLIHVDIEYFFSVLNLLFFLATKNLLSHFFLLVSFSFRFFCLRSIFNLKSHWTCYDLWFNLLLSFISEQQ